MRSRSPQAWPKITCCRLFRVSAAVLRSRLAIAALVIGGLLLSCGIARGEEVITPDSVQGQNITAAAQFLEDMGEIETANAVRQRLASGGYSYAQLEHDADTSKYTGNSVISTELVQFMGGKKGTPFNPNVDLSYIINLAATLYHENVHSNQGTAYQIYSDSIWSGIGKFPHEQDAWGQTIAAEMRWILNLWTQYLTNPQRVGNLKTVAALINALSAYIGSLGENKYFGLPAADQANYVALQNFLEAWLPQINALAQGATSNTANVGGLPDPPVTGPPGGTPSTPPPPTPPQPPTPAPPAPQTPAEMCPECLPYLRAVIELRNELADVQRQIAAQNARIAANQIAQRAAQTRINALQADLAGQQGIGGSGYDPSTGITRESITQANGTVLVTIKDEAGNILEQSVRNRSDLAGVQRDLEAAQAQLASLKTEAAALAKERDRLAARDQVLTARLQDAIQQLADCLEKKCKHLIGQRLNTIAEQFGLNPLTGKPAPPKATNNAAGSSASGGNSSSASSAAESAAGKAINKANETKVSTPPMESGASAGNGKPAAKGAPPSGEPGSGNNNGGDNNGGNDNGADNGANNGNAGDNPPPPAPNPTPAAEKRPKNFRHAQPATDSTGVTEPNQYTVTVCEGTNDYVFRASGEEVDARNVKSTSPNVTGAGFGSGVRISGNHVGSSTIDADFLRFDGTLAAHVKITVTVIDCGHHMAVVPGGNPPTVNPNPPVATGGEGNENANSPGGMDNNPNPAGGNTGGGFMGVLDEDENELEEFNNSFFGNAPAAPTVQNIVITINVNFGGGATATTPGQGALQNGSRQITARDRQQAGQAHARFQPAAYHLGSPSRAPSRELPTFQLSSPQFLASLPSARDLTFSIASNGNLGSKALEFRVHDPSGKLKGNVRLPEGMVLEPLKMGTPNPASTAAGGSNVSQQLTAYCLEMAKLPPQAGQLYRLAPPAVQQKYQPIKAVLQAGSKLAAAGKFHPDSDPAAYADFIRQHALWAQLENWSEQKFTEVFVERTKKNAEHLNVTWTNEMEGALRAAAPGRWRDIAMVLDEAHKQRGATGAP